MLNFDNTPQIQPAATIRGACIPERRGRQTLQELIDAGVIPDEKFLTPKEARVFWDALHGRIDDAAA